MTFLLMEYLYCFILSLAYLFFLSTVCESFRHIQCSWYCFFILHNFSINDFYNLLNFAVLHGINKQASMLLWCSFFIFEIKFELLKHVKVSVKKQTNKQAGEINNPIFKLCTWMYLWIELTAPPLQNTRMGRG